MNEKRQTSSIVMINPSLEDRLFRYGMWWRFIYGTFRLFFGTSILFFIGTPFADLFEVLMAHELSQEPNDILVSFVHLVLSRHDYIVTYFLAGYFIFWGIVDMFLSINILRNRLWAFPTTIVLIVGFLGYALFRLYHTQSLVLSCVIAIDILITWLIWRHYLKIKTLNRNVISR